VFAILVFLYNAEEEIEGESNEKQKVLEQTPVVLIRKYMDLLHLDDSNLWDHLEKIKELISEIINMRNCDYVLEHTSLLENINNMMLPEVGHNLNQGLALLELFQSSTARKTIPNYPGLLESLINEVYNSTTHDIQEHDIRTVSLLCGLADEITVAMKMVTSRSNFIPKLLELINARLSTNVTKLDEYRGEIYFMKVLNLVGILSRALPQIDDNMTRSVFASTPRILESLLSDAYVPLTTEEQKSTIKALTLIDHAKGNAFTINLTSPHLFEARGDANLILGLHKEALADFEAALKHCEYEEWHQETYMLRCVFCKVKLEDYEGALHDADNVVTNFAKSPFILQERGVVKEMMEDYEGAIEDLTEALRGYGGVDYECLKHRAYARFKLGLEIEAHQDAQMANQLGVPDYVEEAMVRGRMSLGMLPVPEFLGYKLT
jgi:tetratricopeptide (TPR) repeat protein